jgi:selenocysteine-specific elongation factor
MEELRDRLRRRIPARLFRAFVEQLELDKAVVRDGSLLRLPDYTITLRDDERRLVEQIKVLLGASPLAPPDLTQLERAVGVGRGRLTGMLRFLEREGSVVRVTADLYFLNESVERVKRTLHEEFSKGDLTPAMFRDRFGTSRKYAIPLLEYFDREGVTVRMGDARRLKGGSRMRHGESHTA